MSDYTPTGDGWIAGPPSVDAGPVEVVRYAVASPTDAAADVVPAEQVWHRPLPSLPTTPGYYVDASGSAWRLDADGVWDDTYGNPLDSGTGGHPEMPLVRLITAAGLLEQVRQAITALGALDGDAKAAVYTALDEIEDSYGVNG